MTYSCEFVLLVLSEALTSSFNSIHLCSINITILTLKTKTNKQTKTALFNVSHFAHLPLISTCQISRVRLFVRVTIYLLIPVYFCTRFFLSFLFFFSVTFLRCISAGVTTFGGTLKVCLSVSVSVSPLSPPLSVIYNICLWYSRAYLCL